MNLSKKNENQSPRSKEHFSYPRCWQDDARAQVLLAPFRERSVNPENYDSKMKFWKDVIVEYCNFKGSACFCKQELQQTFTRGQRVPSCLDTVLLEMQKLRLIRLRGDYEYDPANSWSGWALNSFLKKPLSWGQSRVKSFFGGPDLTQLGLIEFIHLEVMENYCNSLQSLFSQPPFPGTLHHFDRLKDIVCPELNMSEDCLGLCLLTLSSRNKIGLESKPDGCNNRIHLIKIPWQQSFTILTYFPNILMDCNNMDIVAATDGNITITEADHAMHNLESTKESLLKQLDDLELSIKENEDKARLYIGENKRMLAKTYLRKKHLLETNHEKRSMALHNIETLLSNVDEAKHNGMVLEAYRYGSKTLKEVLNASNLTYDNVDEVVADVRESMDNCKDLQDALGNINLNQSVSSQEEDSLEQELRELMGETIEKKSKVPKESNESIPLKVEITDAELLEMLEKLDVEQKSPGKNATLHEVTSPRM